MTYMHKKFLTDTGKKMKEKRDRKEQSNYTHHEDPTASQLRAREPEDEGEIVCMMTKVGQQSKCRQCGSTLINCNRCGVTVCNRCRTPCICDADFDVTAEHTANAAEGHDHEDEVCTPCVEHTPTVENQVTSDDQPAAMLMPPTHLVMTTTDRRYIDESEPPPAGFVKVLVDGGSTCNCFNMRDVLQEARVRDPESTSVAGCNPNASPLECMFNCDISLVLRNVTGTHMTVMPWSEYMYVPQMPHIVISTGYYLDEHGIDFDYKAMLVRFPDGQTASMFRHGRLFYVHAMLYANRNTANNSASHMCNAIVANNAKRHALLWHARFGGLDVDTA